tara:strand:+ start:9572 stop:10348 length:777 start_codon:yes stop_codon:yes gene_type:complete
LQTPQFSAFSNIIANYRSVSGQLPEALLISTGPKGLSTWYAPFEHINQQAKLVICGITPGWQQADKALCAARDALRGDKPEEETLQIAKNTGSFAGVMRNNLTKMLNYIGMDRYLGLNSCTELFGSRSDLVHYTSALRYPVFKDGINYSGSSAMVSMPYLWNQSKFYLGAEIRAIPEALWLPLGASAIKVFERLVRENIIADQQVLFGMPHASGANAERIKYFIGEKPKDQLSSKVNPDIIERGRSALRDKLRPSMAS